MNYKKAPTYMAIVFMLIMMVLAIGYADEQKSVGIAPSDSAKTETARLASLPKLLDLGSKSCIPCRKMAPILDSLREEYKGKAEIVFIDVKEDRDAAIKHKITLIPTQIFFDTTGAEVYRHIGFFPADSIETHLKSLGADL